MAFASSGQVDSFVYYKKLAEKGDTKAQYQTGLYYLIGKDASLAKKWFALAAEKHYPPAVTSLAMLYTSDLLGSKDYTVAFQYAKEASDSGYADGQTQLAYLYFNGLGTTRDSVMAEKLYRAAAAQKQPNAIAMIGYWYFHGGMGMPQNYELALPYVREAANMSVAQSQFELGLMYQHGWGYLEPDTMEALRWYDRASQQVYVPALNNYAWLCYLKKRNIERAIQYIEVAVMLKPKDINSLDTYAGLLALAGEYDQALKWQKSALDNGGIYNGGFIERYGDILCKAGKSKDAMKYWRQAQGIPGHSISLITKISTSKCQ